MGKAFRWILACQDDQTEYELTKDPIGFDDCSYRMERHAKYHGVFNQFTSNLKFHNDGGGKQYIDSKYELFDINAVILITVYKDETGLGDYAVLFTGKLNMANYTADTVHTTLNIEQSDIFAKITARADIPVPINVLNVNLPGQPTFHGVEVATYVPGDHGGVTTGSFIFNDPGIIALKTFYVVTHDGSNVAVYDSVTFTANGVQGPGSISSGTSIQITNIGDGFVEATFTSINGNIILYDASSQLSLGQKAIRSIPTETIQLPGVPIKYDSLFRFKGTINNGTHNFSDSRIQAGHRYYVYSEDNYGNEIMDAVLYTGVSVPGPGIRSNYSFLQITAESAGSLTVQFDSVVGSIELWMDDVLLIASWTPTSTGSVQLFDETPINAAGAMLYRGFETFEVDTIFDNLGKWDFAKESNFDYNGPTTPTNTIDPVSGTTLEDAYLAYPMDIEYNIAFDGSLDEWTTGGPTRDFSFSIQLLWGLTPQEAVTNGRQVVLHSDSVSASPNAHNTFTFTVSDSGTMTLLNRDYKVWLYVFHNELLTSSVAIGQTQEFKFEYTFTSSSINFKAVTKALPTTAQVVMVHEALNQVVDMISDVDASLYSEAYGRTDSEKRTYRNDGEFSLRSITCGHQIRGHQDRYIHSSFNDLFSDLQAIDNIGMDIDGSNRVRIEPISFFFDKTTRIALLEKVFNFETVNDNNRYFNQVEVGYKKFDTEIYYRNGLDEIHGKRFHGTKVSVAKGTMIPRYGVENKSGVGVSNKLDLTTGLIAGNYAIELTRRKNQVWSMDDFKFDDDNFIISLKREVNVSSAVFEEMGGVNYIYLPYGYPIPKVGSQFIVTGTASNDGTYTTVSSSVGAGFSASIITVVESVTLETSGPFIMEPVTGFVVETAIDQLDSDITNVIDSTLSRAWLNMSITPARMLQSAMNLITAGLQKIKGAVQFLDGEANYRAQTTFSNGWPQSQQDYTDQPLSENASIQYNDAYTRNITPIWGTEVYKFEYPLTLAEFNAIKANPNGYIEFYKFEGDNKKGFIVSLEFNLKTGRTMFELLKMYE